MKWKLVPVEPTPEMIDAWNNDDSDEFRHAYRAMLEAAHEAPASALSPADKRIKVKLGSQYGSDLNGHWFYLRPADEYAEAALAKHTGKGAPEAPAVQETWSAEQCAQVLRALRYIQGIAERGEGRPMRNNESLEEFCSGMCSGSNGKRQRRRPICGMRSGIGGFVTTWNSTTARTGGTQ